MPRISPAARIGLGLVSLTVGILFVVSALGLIPDRRQAVLEKRKALSEAMAIHFSYCAQAGDISTFQATTKTVVDRNPEIVSAAVRRADGHLLFEVGEHEAGWGDNHGLQSSPTHVCVPITAGSEPWGAVELRFKPIDKTALWAPLNDPIFPIAGFVAVAGFLVYYGYLRILFRRFNFDPSLSIPKRVRTTLDSLVEGVVIMDNQERIAIANSAFAELVGRPPGDLEGRKVSELSWAVPGTAQPHALPWQRTVEGGAAELGTVLSLHVDGSQPRTLSVNSAPIMADDGTQRGIMATFDNLTVLEKKNAHLKKLLQKLKNSRQVIHEQNQALRMLATRDPLTDCLNRRAFFEVFESQWSAAERYGTPLSCVMVDIDHFKSINDRYGHATGDLVLQQVAETLNTLKRKSDVICRYGGEEFCVLLPQIDLEGAMQAAERFRGAIAAPLCAGIKVTASLGVAVMSLEATDPRELLDQADLALYAAKREGRNRVLPWNPRMRHEDKAAPDVRHATPKEDQRSASTIPFHAVTALVSALGYRHADTAEHSRRVADLCVAAASGLMSQSDSYVLEVAALLHDIGKLGVPDAVLLKPGPLDPREWTVIRTHEGMGEAIISSAFSCDLLTEIVCKHHCWYGGSPHDAGLPKGDEIPLGARLLSIADAYDAMVSDRVYRKGRPRAAAFAELRRCAGSQFDPELVERFIAVVMASDESRTPAFSVSKQTALKVGVQIERLACALDAGDNGSLALMASHLNAMAALHDIPPIAAAAARLEKCTAANDRVEITRTTIELLDLCRTTYRSYLPTVSA